MNPDRMLEAFRESTGPDADARTRLMGRLATLGPPPAAPAPPRSAWPWVAVGGLAAAAALALWLVPRGQAKVEGSSDPSMASDQARVDAPDGRTVSAPATREPAPTAPRSTPEPSPNPIVEPAPIEPLETALEGPRKARRRVVQQPPPKTTAETTAETTAPPEPPPPQAPDSLAAELRLITQARSALSRGDAAAALTHLRAHADTFETPRLGEEASALRAMARCTRDGPDEDATGAFARRFPTSMFRARVKKACSPERGPSDAPAKKNSPE